MDGQSPTALIISPWKQCHVLTCCLVELRGVTCQVMSRDKLHCFVRYSTHSRCKTVERMKQIVSKYNYSVSRRYAVQYFWQHLSPCAISGIFRDQFTAVSCLRVGSRAYVARFCFENSKHRGLDLFLCIAQFSSSVSQLDIVQSRQNLYFSLSGNFRHPFVNSKFPDQSHITVQICISPTSESK